LRGFGGEAASPVRPVEVETEAGFAGADEAESGRADEFRFAFSLPFALPFQSSGPEAVGFVRLAEVFGAETVDGFFFGPGGAADITADLWIGVHGNEGGFVFGLMGAEEETVCFEKGH